MRKLLFSNGTTSRQGISRRIASNGLGFTVSLDIVTEAPSKDKTPKSSVARTVITPNLLET
jgi:hypothetical protein